MITTRNLGGEYVVHEDRGSTEWRFLIDIVDMPW